jgi:hypothetical protein
MVVVFKDKKTWWCLKDSFLVRMHFRAPAAPDRPHPWRPPRSPPQLLTAFADPTGMNVSVLYDLGVLGFNVRIQMDAFIFDVIQPPVQLDTQLLLADLATSPVTGVPGVGAFQ